MLVVMVTVCSRRPAGGVRLEHAVTSALELVLQEKIVEMHPRPVEAPSFSEVLAHCGELILREFHLEAESHQSQSQFGGTCEGGMWAQLVQQVERARKHVHHAPLAQPTGSECRARRRILAQNLLHKFADGMPARARRPHSPQVAPEDDSQ